MLKKRSTDNSFVYLFTILLVILLYFLSKEILPYRSTLYLNNLISLSLITGLMLLFLVPLIKIDEGIPSRYIRLYISLLLFSCYTLFDANLDININYEVFLYNLSIIIIFSILSLYGFKMVSLNVLAFYLVAIDIIYLIFLAIYKFNYSNSVGLYCFVTFYFTVLIIIKSSNILIRIILFINLLLLFVLIINSHSRTSMLGIGIFLVTYLIWGKIKNYFSIFSVIITLIMMAITSIYMWLTNTTIGWTLNLKVNEITGKNLFSGRQYLWELAISDWGKSNPFFGQGINSVLINDLNTNGYLHNLYVQLLYQYGIIGVLLFIIMVYTIGSFFDSKIDRVSKVTASFFISILFIQTFEGLLLFDFNINTLLIWVGIGLGISYSINSKVGLK